MTNANDTLFSLVEKEVLIRLRGEPCESCGSTGISVAELEFVRKWLNDHGYIRPASGYPSDAEKQPSLTHGTPFVEEDTPHKTQAGG